MLNRITIFALVVCMTFGCASAPNPDPQDPYNSPTIARFEEEERLREEEWKLLAPEIDQLERIMWGDKEEDRAMLFNCIHTQSFIDGEDIHHDDQGEFTHLIGFGYRKFGLMTSNHMPEIYYQATSYQQANRIAAGDVDLLVREQRSLRFVEWKANELFLYGKDGFTLVVTPPQRAKGQVQWYSRIVKIPDVDYKPTEVFFCQTRPS